MKCSLAIALALSATTPTVAYNVGGYGRFVTPRGRFARAGRRCSPQQQQGSNRCVDRAFEDLAAELNQDRFRGRGRRSPWKTQGLQIDEETIQQQQAFLNRAFGLVEDVAGAVASSPREVKEADEAIRQSKEWADRMFGFARDMSSGDTYDSSVRSEMLQDDQKLFQVALDVPGVKESDLDVTVEGTKDKTLIVSGKRNVGKDEDGVVRTKKFSKTFALDPSSDIDQMSASLDNGVLTVSVPRTVMDETETIQKVSVKQVSEGFLAEESETEDQPFQLQLDVPGVSASNIDIEVKGDTDKTLTITAVREMGKDSEGNPRTTELSKSFQVNELVDMEKIVATLNNGVLAVSAPADEKKAEKSVKKITVSQSSGMASPVEEPAADDESVAADSGEDDEAEA